MSYESSKPVLIVLSGPSGVGKGTLCKLLLKSRQRKLSLSVSATSRPPRPGEVEAIDYFFKTRAMFEDLIASDAFLEWAEYNGHYYGTPLNSIRTRLSEGQSVLLEIDVQGALQVKQHFPEACLVFILPPSLEILETRLRGRGNNSEEEIKSRMAIAASEIEQMKAHSDFTVVNDDLDTCLQRLEDIIASWPPKRPRSLD
ncbi:MAG: guanylate kinase [Vampirovibrionales bacterium]|nr:guanylate kinase [Vampirovibrionales bacterium]